MKSNIKEKKHLFVKRAKIIRFLQSEGYNGEEIATIFNIDRSRISIILAQEAKYKGLVRSVLKD